MPPLECEVTALATSHHPPRWDGVPKRCTTCGDHFPRAPEFWHTKYSCADGLACSCKTCARAYKRDYRDRHRHPVRAGSVLAHPNGDRAREVADILHVATMTSEQVANELGVSTDAVGRIIGRLIESGVPVKVIGQTEAWNHKGQGASMSVYRIVYPRGRICASCGTVLNRYNAGPYCGAHRKSEEVCA